MIHNFGLINRDKIKLKDKDVKSIQAMQIFGDRIVLAIILMDDKELITICDNKDDLVKTLEQLELKFSKRQLNKERINGKDFNGAFCGKLLGKRYILENQQYADKYKIYCKGRTARHGFEYSLYLDKNDCRRKRGNF